MPHVIPPLSYAYSALEPFIDQETMMVHHDKHHQAYCDKFNAVLSRYPKYSEINPTELLSKLDSLGDIDAKDKLLIRNQGGGYVNHNLFWSIMAPQKEIDEKLVIEIMNQFDSIEAFKEKFNEAALNHFGSGWVWLVRDPERKLKIYSLPNQETPYALHHQPILTLDVWEHAYYLKYQNRRNEYINNWWHVLKLI
jgi:Fe-Mn family superoxide dismutase